MDPARMRELKIRERVRQSREKRKIGREREEAPKEPKRPVGKRIFDRTRKKIR